MDIKNILVGAVAATVVGSASASTSASSASGLEQKEKMQVMTSILGELTAVVSHPECTIKGSKTKK